MTGHILLVGGWTRLYAKAKAAGYRVTVVTAAGALTAEDRAHVDRHIDLDMSSASVPSEAESVHRQDPFDCVVSMREMGLDNAALLVDRLGVAGNPRRPVELTRDKLALRRHLDAAGLSPIPYLSAPGEPELAAFGARHGWPVILKGTRGYGSAETTMVNGPEEVSESFTRIGHAPGAGDVLAEAFIPGPEFSVETFSWQGEHTLLAITEKTTTGPPSFVEVQHTVPAQLPGGQHTAVADLVTAMLDSVGHQMGPAHTEVILSPDGPVIVEAHTRAGGGFIYDLTEYVTGVDVFAELFRALAGDVGVIAPKQDGVATTRYMTFPPGVVRSIDGVAEAMAVPGVLRCSVDVEVGQTIAAPTSSFNRHGYVVAHASSRAATLAAVDDAMARVRVAIE
ncbi:MAG TPA: ATP-grasp domain-containing protein [Streptosporangiaceae bacterium]|nr:ATP-grasp domain-containing protein [Streptosporangiaceae bacterium]